MDDDAQTRHALRLQFFSLYLDGGEHAWSLLQRAAVMNQKQTESGRMTTSVQICRSGSNRGNCNKTTAFYRGFVEWKLGDNREANFGVDKGYASRPAQNDFLARTYGESRDIPGLEVLATCAPRSG